MDAEGNKIRYERVRVVVMILAGVIGGLLAIYSINKGINIDKAINIILLCAASGCAFIILVLLRIDRKSIKWIFLTALLCVSSILLGVFLVYFFHGSEAVIETLKLQKAYIVGKYIIVGYGCLIGLILSLFVRVTSNKKNKRSV